MKNKKLFEKTISVLVKAYQDGTLEYSSCAACACGNLAAAAENATIVKDHTGQLLNEFMWLDKNGDEIEPVWSEVFCAGQKYTYEHLDNMSRKIYRIGLQQIKKTGYTVEEFMRIEEAFFQGSDNGNTYKNDQNQFNGLLAVYNVLCDIHEVNKEEVKSGELVFVKQ